MSHGPCVHPWLVDEKHSESSKVTSSFQEQCGPNLNGDHNTQGEGLMPSFSPPHLARHFPSLKWPWGILLI